MRQNNCTMILEIITPEKKAFEGEVTSGNITNIS